MRIQIGRPPEHGFDEPLGLLSDCHRRIERFLGAMVIIAQRARGAALDPSDQDVLLQCRRYFATAGPRHTQDEEESLFPRLRRSSSDGAREALARVERLEAEHRQAEALHDRVEARLARWLDERTLAADEVEALLEDLSALQGIYAQHIRIEDEELFPAAAAALSSDEVRAIGREMAKRRGISL